MSKVRRKVASPRNSFNRAVGSGGGGTGIDQGKLSREMSRVLGKASKMTNDLMEFNTPKIAWGAIKQGRVKIEHAIEIAYNLRLIPDQISVTANQAAEMIKQAATSELGSFDVAPVRQIPAHQAAPIRVDDGKPRPLSRDERRHAKQLQMEATEYLLHIRQNPGLVTERPTLQLFPMKTAQGGDAFTGNGLKDPNQVGRDESQQETMRSLPRQEKHEHQTRATDTIQTESSTDPIPHEHAGPTRHAESKAARVARLQRELEAAQRELRQSSYLESIKTKLASLNEGQLVEVEAVVDDFLYADALLDNVNVSEPARPAKVAKGEVISPEQIDALLEPDYEDSEDI